MSPTNHSHHLIFFVGGGFARDSSLIRSHCVKRERTHLRPVLSARPPSSHHERNEVGVNGEGTGDGRTVSLYFLLIFGRETVPWEIKRWKIIRILYFLIITPVQILIIFLLSRRMLRRDLNGIRLPFTSFTLYICEVEPSWGKRILILYLQLSLFMRILFSFPVPWAWKLLGWGNSGETAVSPSGPYGPFLISWSNRSSHPWFVPHH